MGDFLRENPIVCDGVLARKRGFEVYL